MHARRRGRPILTTLVVLTTAVSLLAYATVWFLASVEYVEPSPAECETAFMAGIIWGGMGVVAAVLGVLRVVQRPLCVTAALCLVAVSLTYLADKRLSLSLDGCPAPW